MYKFIDGNKTEEIRLNDSEIVKKNLYHAKEGDSFILSETIDDGQTTINLELKPIETPGHMSDHLCFLFKEETIKNNVKSEKYSIFTGDHIVGATSTFFEDYPSYFDSLLKTQKVISEYDIEHMYVAHSLTLKNKDIGVPAAAKN